MSNAAHDVEDTVDTVIPQIVAAPKSRVLLHGEGTQMIKSTRSGRVDYLIVLAVVFQLVVGAVFVYSTSLTYSEKLYGDQLYLFRHHLVSVVFALGLAVLVFSKLSTSFLQKHATWFFVTAVLLMLFVLVPGLGRHVNGVRRWISIGPLTISAFPIAMLLASVYFSDYLSRHTHSSKSLSRSAVELTAAWLLFCILTLLQPDLSNALIFAALTFLISVRAGWYRFALTIAAAFAVSLSLLAALAPYSYRWHRLTTFLHPFDERLDIGYQLSNSLTAIGGGDLWGVGFGEGFVKARIPGVHSEFIFSALVEERGAVLAAILILSSALIAWRGLMIAWRLLCAKQLFEGLLAYGLVLWMALETISHLGGAMGLIPAMNSPYPLVSYGGTYLAIFMVGCAVVLKLGSQCTTTENPQERVRRRAPRAAYGLTAIFIVCGVFLFRIALWNNFLDKQYATAGQSLRRER